MRRVGAFTMLLVTLAACSSASPRPVSTPGRPPQHVGEGAFCNLLAPIEGAGRFFYPSTYPAAFLPRAERCFATVAEARAAGLQPAPPPRGSRLVSGIYLVPTGRAMLATCRRAARRLAFAVACPELTPAPSDALNPVPEAVGEFLLEESFGAPPSYVGAGTVGFGSKSIGHMWVESLPGPPSWGFCTGVRFLFRIEVGDRDARYLSCPNGSETHSGHVLLVWREAGATHVVSLHGRTVVNRRIDYVLVNHSRIVRP
jgi:hypothetical protein